MQLVFHITTRDRWQSAQQVGTYEAESLETQGFIHCSTLEQVAPVANAIFAGETDLVLLWIDVDKLRSPLRFELPINPHTGQPEPNVTEQFPHLYGALNLEAVIKATDFEPDADGTFNQPVLLPNSSL
jgi:uncharacterized protein (DUF952 family)